MSERTPSSPSISAAAAISTVRRTACLTEPSTSRVERVDGGVGTVHAEHQVGALGGFGLGAGDDHALGRGDGRVVAAHDGSGSGQVAGMTERAADRQPGERSVVAAIRDAIVRGEFVPNQRLVEADPSGQFAASRATVRAALIELTNEGLVERV